MEENKNKNEETMNSNNTTNEISGKVSEDFDSLERKDLSKIKKIDLRGRISKSVPVRDFSDWKGQVGIDDWQNEREFLESLDSEKFLNENAEELINETLEGAEETFATVMKHNRFNSGVFVFDESEEELIESFEDYVNSDLEGGEPRLFSMPKKIDSIDHFNIQKLNVNKYLSIKLKPGLYSVLLTSSDFKDIESTLTKLCEEDPRIYFLVEYCMLHLDLSKELIVDYLVDLHPGMNISRIKSPTIMFSKFKNYISPRLSVSYDEYREMVDLDSWIVEKEIFDFVFSCLIVLMWKSRINFEVSIKEHFIFDRMSNYGMPVQDVDYFVKSAWMMKESKQLFELFKQLSFDDSFSNDRFLIDDTFQVKIEKFFRSFASIRAKAKTVFGDCTLVSILLLVKNADLPIVNREWTDPKLLNMPELDALSDIFQMWLPMWDDMLIINSLLDESFSYHSIKSSVERVYDTIFSENPLFEIKDIKGFKELFDIVLTRNKVGSVNGLEIRRRTTRTEKYQQISYADVAGRTIFSTIEPDILTEYVTNSYQNCSSIGFKNLLEIRDFSCDFEKELDVILVDSCLVNEEARRFSIEKDLLTLSILNEGYISFPEGYSEYCKDFLKTVLSNSDEEDKRSAEFRDIISKISHTTNLNGIKLCYRVNTEGPFIKGLDSSILRDEIWTKNSWIAVMAFLNQTLKPGRIAFVEGKSSVINTSSLELRGGSFLHLANKFLAGKRIGEKRNYKVKFYGNERDFKIAIPYFLGWQYLVKQSYIFDRSRISNQRKVNMWIKTYEEIQDSKIRELDLDQSEGFLKMVKLKRARKKFSWLNKLFIDSFAERVSKSVNLRVLSGLDRSPKALGLLNNPLFRMANENLIDIFTVILINSEFEIMDEGTLIDWVESIFDSEAIYNVTIA